MPPPLCAGILSLLCLLDPVLPELVTFRNRYIVVVLVVPWVLKPSTPMAKRPDVFARIGQRSGTFWHPENLGAGGDAVEALHAFKMLVAADKAPLPGFPAQSSQTIICSGPCEDRAMFLHALDRGQHIGVCTLVTCPGRADAPAARLRCARCCVAVYCSPECQRADWPRHKPECAEFSKATTGADGSAEKPSTAAAAPQPLRDLPLGTPVRLYGLVATPHRNGSDGVVEGPLEGGRQRVRLPPAPGSTGGGESLLVKPQNLLEVAPASEAFARAAVLLTMNSAVVLANLHYGWRAQDDGAFPYPPILHIEIAADGTGAPPEFRAPLRWRAQAFFPDVPGMRGAGATRGQTSHWLNGTPQVSTFLESAALEVLRPAGRAGATAIGDALRSGVAIFVLITLSRPDRRYVHAILLHHAVAMHELRGNRARVVAAAHKAEREEGGVGGSSAGGSLGACALRLRRCTSFCVEPTVGGAEAAAVLANRFHAMFSKLYDGDDGETRRDGSARTPVLSFLVAPPPPTAPLTLAA